MFALAMAFRVHIERCWQRLWSETLGQDIVEAALVFPILFTILIGIFWLGRAYNIYSTINQAARVGALAAASQTCGSCGNASPTPDVVALTYVKPVLDANNLDSTMVPSPTPANLCPCGTASCVGSPVACAPFIGAGVKPSVCVQQNVDMGSPTYDPPVCGTAVSFSYPLNIPIPFAPTSVQNIMIRAEMKARIEQ